MSVPSPLVHHPGGAPILCAKLAFTPLFDVENGGFVPGPDF